MEKDDVVFYVVIAILFLSISFLIYLTINQDAEREDWAREICKNLSWEYHSIDVKRGKRIVSCKKEVLPGIYAIQIYREVKPT